MNCDERIPQVGETIEPVLDRLGDWPATIESVHGYGSGQIDANFTLPFVDTLFGVSVAMDGETVLSDPTPKHGIRWYRVNGIGDGSPRSRVFLAREQALRFFDTLEGAEMQTFINEKRERSENAYDLAREFTAAN